MSWHRARAAFSAVAVGVSTVLLATGCAASSGSAEAGGGAPSTPTATETAPSSQPALEARAGERLLTVAVPGGAYQPAPPPGATDDYRCFLVDPHLTQPTFVTGVQVLPGNPAVAHHAIVYRVLPSQVRAARAHDAAQPGTGWTCFGGPGLPAPGGPGSDLDAAPWVAAWAPGGDGGGFRRGLGIRLAAGTQLVLQMHYNTRAGDGPDATRVLLRLAPGSADLTPLDTMLLPAPVELPCPSGDAGPLCDRDRSVLDLISRFGDDAGQQVAGIGLLCGPPGGPRPGPTQHCDRTVDAPMTVYAAAGHMHLLGRSIRIVLNPGRQDERVLLDVPVYNFDDQGAVPLAPPVHVEAGDVLRVQCTHDVGLRDLLPALAGTEPRYVTWGEGTTDEMCLGILMVSRP